MNESIILGGGCFWCLEAVFQRVRGVEAVVNGYAGGEIESPSYEAVCSGSTGHAEVVKIKYNPNSIDLETLLDIFWVIHDPTTLNQQGADIGSQYRSVIFYNNKEQQKIIETSLRVSAQSLWKNPVVTEVAPLKKFWPAEDYLQDYFNNHPEQAYCQIIISPKVAKLKKNFSHLLSS